MEITDVVRRLEDVAAGFARERRDRQLRRHLERTDFDAIRDAGFLLVPVPRAHGGLYVDARSSMRPICECLRVLAHGDSSVALVGSMHPAVLAIVGWMEASQEPPAAFAQAWEEQRAWVFETARDGHFWGTVTSEPGSGGDLLRTKATAVRIPGGGFDYRLSGAKHFGSGTGMTSYVITTAVPEGEPEPDWFAMDFRDNPFDGTQGAKITVPWDGQGMTATQSHAMDLLEAPAVRAAWPGFAVKSKAVRHLGGPALFAAVVTGIVEVAMETARAQLKPRRDAMRAFEQVEWTRAETEAWLIGQGYEGMLRAIETDGARNILLGKLAISELAESCLARVSKVIGGGAYSRTSPWPHWYEDVRALGFLRPPWALAYDQARDGLKE